MTIETKTEKENKTKLSIIMPCFNVAKTLKRAFDSIFMQKVNFVFDVIIIDDASTDDTVKVAELYAKAHNQIKVLRNDINKGNAYSYYRGLCYSQSDYICVLDGDDYYTISDKLQRQVDFLDSDVDEEFIGTATQFIIDLGNGNVSVPDRGKVREFSYADFLTGNSGYYHTATYMYRNIFKNNVPEIFSMALYRGDTPRTMFFLKYSGKKIKILDFIGSAYTFEFHGIWSGLNEKQQFLYQVNYQMKHKELADTDFERNAAEATIKLNLKKMLSATNNKRKYQEYSIDNVLKSAKKYAETFAFAQFDFMLKHIYYSSYIDSLCSSLGYINIIRNPMCKISEVNNKNLCIIIGTLKPHGGGIFTEIEELIKIYAKFKVYLIITNMDEVPKEVSNKLLNYPNLNIVCPTANIINKIEWLQTKLAIIKPYRNYFYCSHQDTYGCALAQPGVCENIALFSFDHGYICGISNPNLDTIIAKRKIDYWLLKKKFKNRVIYIPTWSFENKEIEQYKYIPFFEHDKIITASGAARFNKIAGATSERYLDVISDLLIKTGGKHYHFGPLTDEFLAEIKNKLSRNGIKEERFIHVEWSDNIPLDLLEKHVDLFIEPFPIVTYKLTLQVLSVGIPIAIRKGLTRMSIADFVPNDSITWLNKSELINILNNIDVEYLKKASRNAKKYFETVHFVKNLADNLFENKGKFVDDMIDCADNSILEVTDSLRLFDKNFNISINRMADKILFNEEETEEQEIIKNTSENFKKIQAYDDALYQQVKEIRESKSFKLGYVLTFPIKAIKSYLSYAAKYGPINGLFNLQKNNILSLCRDNPEDELIVITHSVAFKVGNIIATPYRWLKR